MPYIKQSVYRPKGNPGRGINPLDSLTLIDVDDIAYMPSPDDRGVMIEDDIILKPGKYAIALYMTPGTIEVTSPAEGETDQIGFTPSVKFNHPGNKRDIREFKINNINTKFIVIVNYCSGEESDLIGTICNPVKMVPSYTGNKDGNTNEFTMSQINKGDDIFMYAGTVPLEEPVAVVPAEAKNVDYVSNGQYQLSAGTASINAISAAPDGAVITLLGASGAKVPSVVSGESILLKGGKPFVATEGSQLTLRAISAGANKTVWVEQSRHEMS